MDRLLLLARLWLLLVVLGPRRRLVRQAPHLRAGLHLGDGRHGCESVCAQRDWLQFIPRASWFGKGLLHFSLYIDHS